MKSAQHHCSEAISLLMSITRWEISKYFCIFQYHPQLSTIWQQHRKMLDEMLVKCVYVELLERIKSNDVINSCEPLRINAGTQVSCRSAIKNPLLEHLFSLVWNWPEILMSWSSNSTFFMVRSVIEKELFQNILKIFLSVYALKTIFFLLFVLMGLALWIHKGKRRKNEISVLFHSLVRESQVSQHNTL